MPAFHEPTTFPFVAALEAAFPAILEELRNLPADAFAEAPDSLTTAADGYDERGWHYYPLFGSGDHAAHRDRCPATARACDGVPGLVNAAFSRFRPGTHLYPHHGELRGVLRCHLALVVPEGDVALRIGDDVRRWHAGRCLVFDDTFEHDAWNKAAGDRVVLLITFARP